MDVIDLSQKGKAFRVTVENFKKKKALKREQTGKMRQFCTFDYYLFIFLQPSEIVFKRQTNNRSLTLFLLLYDEFQNSLRVKRNEIYIFK